MSIQEAIDLEHAKLQAHRASPDAGQDCPHTTEAITLAAHMLMIVAEPPECQKCHEGGLGDSLHPLRMNCHKLGLCVHYNLDATVLKPDQDYVNGQCQSCRRPLRGIQGKAECADQHRPLELYEPYKITPVTTEGHWGCTFLKGIDLLHSFGDCLDLDRPSVVDGKLFMQFHDWMLPIYDESEEPQMVDDNPALSFFCGSGRHEK